MKKMNNYQNVFIGFGLICAVCLILIGLSLGLPDNNGNSGKQIAEKSFKDQVSEKKKELEDAKGSYCPDTIVLNNTTKERAESLAKRLGAKVRLTKQGDYAVLYLPEGTAIEDVYENEDYQADILTMTPDYTVRTMAVDALGRELMASRPQYIVNDTYYQSQGYLDYLNMQDSWKTSKGNGMKVAVIDTGIDTDNPEFAGRISDMSYNASDDKIVKDYGISVIEDTDGHGTQVAGVLAAGMDGRGITGIAPEVQLIVIKCETDGRGKFVRGSDLVFGLAYAIACDANVINMSFGTGSNVFSKYTKLAVDSDIICVAAAGNDGSGMPIYPAADDYVIGVGAMEADGWNIDDYSNFGDNSDIIAPGTVYTTAINNDYRYSNGTSMACPIASGAIALYLSTHPNTEYSRICRLLEASCVDLGNPGEDWFYGYGALDICAFLCGEQGTITYDMQTDEVKNQTQTFVKGHSVQTMPEPERDNVVFDGWFFDPECTDECEYYTHIFTEDTTLYANWINEDEGSAYIYVIQPDDTVEIRSYTGKRRYLTVPDKLEGRTVSSIGDDAFKNNSRLRTVDLPSTVKKIGDRAFMYCSNLREIDIPENVKTIGTNAFTGCVRMTSVGIAAKGQLTSIGDGAFSMCSISSFLIPENLTQLGKGVFLQSTGMRSVTVAQGNKSFKIKNDAIYDNAGETLLYYPAALAGEYQVSSGTIEIDYAAFAYGQINQIILPAGLLKIGEKAFYAENGLQKVIIPESVSSMEIDTFAYCQNLSEVEFEGNSNLEEIPGRAFTYCGRLKEISIPDKVKTIQGSAFLTSGLERITFSERSKLQSIEKCALSYTSINTINLPDTVVNIGDSCFSYSKLNTIHFSDSSQCESIGASAFFYCPNLSEIEFPDSLVHLGTEALCYTGIKKIHIGANLTNIEPGAFAYCKSLEEISVSEGNTVYAAYDGLLYDRAQTIIMLCPASRSGNVILADSTQEIQKLAFAGTDLLDCVTMNEGLQTIGANAFCNSSIQTPTLPSTLISIGEYAFSECKQMTERLLIPKAVINLGRYTVYNDTNLREIEIESDSNLSSIGYGTFSKCGIESFTIPENVSYMGQEVFAGCENLITVTFEGENQLRNLAAWTFWGADNLRGITFEEGSCLELIEARACENMGNLYKIDLSGCNNLITIDNYAFNSCEKLNTILLPDNLDHVGRYAFWGCNNLSRIDLPETVSWIGRYAFVGTNQINVYFKSSVLPSNLETNWDSGIAGYYLGVEDTINSGDWTYALTKDNKASVIAYHGSSEQINLSTIDGYEVVSIGGKAFKGNDKLKSITLPETLTGIYKEAFADTSALNRITLPKSLEIIDSEAFRNSGLSQVVFADKSGLKLIGKYAFAETKSLKEFTIPAGVQRISGYAFWKSGIENVTLVEGSVLNEIERFAFADSAIKSMNLPDSVTKVGDSAFRETAALNEISFGNGEEMSLGSHAFYGSGLETVSIPAGVTKIGELCFTACECLTAINVDNANEKYSSDGGVLFNKAMTTLITCPAGKTGNYNIQASVSRLAFAAFEGSKLSVINIPDDSNLITIGYRAFFRCENLESIHIPSGVQSIENYSFAYDKALTTVEIGQGSRLNGIYKSAFFSCNNLLSISIPDTVQEIGDYAFYDCTALSQVEFGENSSLKGVFDHAFEHSGITAFAMPNQMTELGESAFRGSALREFSFNDAVTDLGSMALADLSNLETDEIVIPDSVEFIGAGLLVGNQSLRKISIPFIGAYKGDVDNTFSYLFDRELIYLRVEEVTISAGTLIPNNAFDRMESLRRISLSDSITVIGDSAFKDCINMQITGLPSYLRVIGSEAFACFYESGDFYTGTVFISDLPDTLETIGILAFYGCRSNDRFLIPACTDSIADGAFSGIVDLVAIDVDSKNKYYSSVDGILYNSKKTDILSVPGKLSGDILIADGVEHIKRYAFAGCTQITKITIPDSVKTIGYSAFNHCEGLEEIILPNSNISLGSQCFMNCHSLKSFTLPEKITDIGNSILYRCLGLKELYIYSNIGDKISDMLNGCRSLEHLELPEGLTYFSGRNMESLKELVLPESVELIDILNCKSLSYLYAGASLESVGYGFQNCDNLSHIDISEDNPYYISVEGVVYDKNMETLIFAPRNKSGYLTIPEGVKKISNYAFENCKSITGVKVPDSVTEIGKEAFKGCSSLMDISLGNYIKKIGLDAFTKVGYLNRDNYYLDDYHTVFDNKKWDECYKDGALYIGAYMVGQVDTWGGSSKVVVKDGTRLIADAAYWQNRNIQYLYLPDSLQIINGGAFSTCINLKYVSFGNGIKEISESAFSQTAIQGVYLGDSIETIGSGAFYECNQLKHIWIDNPDVECGDFLFDSSLKTLKMPVQNVSGTSKKIIVPNANEVDSSYISWFNSISNGVYIDSRPEETTIGEDINLGNKIFFRDDWHSIIFLADNILISSDALQTGSVVQIPSFEEVKEAVPHAEEPIGWDINSDGKADKMPATLTEDIVAVAVYDTPITSIEMEDAHVLELGRSYTLETKCLPEEHTHDERLVFTSSNNSIVSVDKNGKITGVSTGNAIITAKLAENEEIKAECSVTVIQMQNGIKLDETEGSLNVGETLKLSPRYVLPEGYTEETVWTSSEPAVAEVTDGTITAKAPGHTRIDITRGEYSASYFLNVLQPLSSISLNEEEFDLTVGDTRTLTVRYVPENTTVNKTVIWYSSQPEVAVVDDTGIVTAKGPGTAQIHAMVEDKDVFCTVTVTAPIKSVILNTSTGTMRLDRTKQLEMIFTPANTSDDTTVTWSSADPKIATVSDTGLVTAVTKGKTIITGTVLTGTEREMSATYTVTVIGLKDTKTGIIVANSNDTEMDDDISLSVSYVNESNDFDVMANQVQTALDGDKMEDMQIFDITLMKDNSAVQPETSVDVEIPVEEEMAGEGTVVYRLESDGTLTDMGASYENGNYIFATDHFSVYVIGRRKPRNKVKSIQLTPDEMTICPGKTANLSVKVLPDDAEDKTVSWSSSDEGIVTVSSEGKITAMSEGSAAITVQAKDGSGVKEFARVVVAHIWDQGNVTTAPTSTEPGVKTYICTVCGNKKTVEIPVSSQSWSLSDDGTLRISGTGEIPDYSSDKNSTSGHAPWFNDRESIKRIVIDEGITKIGKYAFLDCKNALSVDIPDNVTVIDEGAFEYCDSLSEVNIPDSVTEIGCYAFFYCKKLNAVSIGSGLELWDTYQGSFYPPFFECTNLTSISVSNDNKYFASEDGILFTKDKTELICYPSAKQNFEYIIPETVKHVKDAAFAYCQHIRRIVLPAYLNEIGMAAFAYSDSLCEMVFCGSDPVIGRDILFGINGLYIYYPDNYDGWKEIIKDNYNGHNITWVSYTKNSTPISEVAHVWSEWQVTKPMTETEDGEKTRTCSRCGAEEKKVIPKLIHINTFSEKVTLSQARFEYDETEHRPTVTIEGLTENVDFSVRYENNIDVGQASVIITGKGAYTGELTVPFEIYDYLPGDLDGNKKVNTTDVVLLRRYIAEGYDVTINEDAADVNADNKINTIDVIMLRRYIVGDYGVELIRRPKN